MFRLKIVLVIFVITFWSACCQNRLFKYNYFKCKYNYDVIYPNASCFAKSHNRTFSAVNGYAKSKTPLYALWVRFLIFVSLEFCSFWIPGRDENFVQVRNNLPWSREHASNWLLYYDERDRKAKHLCVLDNEAVQGKRPKFDPWLSIHGEWIEGLRWTFDK